MFVFSYIEGFIRGRREKPKDLIIEITGSFGLYHFLLSVLVFFSKIGIAFHQMAIIFLAPPTKHTCDDEPMGCPCPNPVFDKSTFTRTLIMEFNLICDKKWMASMSQTVFQAGTLVGSVLFGMLSDRFGRRKPMILAACIQILFGVAAAYTPIFEVFTILRFLIGISVGGTMVVGFVILMEFIGPDYRELMSALYQTPFNVGHMLLPLLGYYFRDYSNFQLSISLPMAGMLLYFFYLPETPRWLLAMKQTERAIVLLKHVAKVNGRQRDDITGDIMQYQRNAEKNKLKKGNLTDLFRTPNLRIRILAMAFNWLACSYCFYGVSQYVGQLSGNIFLNVLCSAAVTFCGTLLSIPLMKIMGRKTLVMAGHFVCFTCLFVLAVYNTGLVAVICASIGVVSAFIVFVVVYLYCGEMFPTVVRNAAVGFSSMTARIGSMIAPFVLDLKDINHWLSPLVFGLVPFVAFFVTMLLPETKGCELTTTIEEGERFGKKKKPKKTGPVVG